MALISCYSVNIHAWIGGFNCNVFFLQSISNPAWNLR